MTKRQQFVVTSIILTAGFLVMQLIDPAWRYQAIFALTFLAFILSFWSLSFSFKKDAFLLLLVLPTMFTGGIGLFYFLLPQALLSQIPILVAYAIGIYALLLTSNIYRVAAERTIALLRAAHAVGFILTLFTAFLFFDTIFLLRSDFWLNGLLASVVSLPLSVHGLWSVHLEPILEKNIILYSLALSLVAGEIAIALSFWPITPTVAGLVLTTVLYIGLGLGQAYLQQRLFQKTVKEYFLVGAIVFLATFFTARWGG